MKEERRYSLNTYKFEITEILQKIVNIKADSKKEAYKIIGDMYKDEEIVLDSDDFIESVINIVE